MRTRQIIFLCAALLGLACCDHTRVDDGKTRYVVGQRNGITSATILQDII